MLREFFQRLQTFSPIPRTDLFQMATESAQAFDTIIDFLRGETFSHPAINTVTTVCWCLIAYKDVPVLLDPSGGRLSSLHFLCVSQNKPHKDLVLYLLPYRYLDLIQTDPLMQCCAIVNMASQGCDYYAHRLDPAVTPHRAQAYEAELLRALHPLAEREGLAWKLNSYLQGVLHTYPDGLASLPLEQRYAPPSYLRHPSLSPTLGEQRS